MDHQNKTLRRMEAGKKQTHKLPLPEWTPPATAHTVANHFSALSASPSHSSANILFYFYGPVALWGFSTSSFSPPWNTNVETMSNTLCVVGSMFGKSRAYLSCRRPWWWHAGLIPWPLSVSGSAEAQQGKAAAVPESAPCVFSIGLQSVFLPSQECGPCYVMNMGSVVGIIASDIFLTIFIIICVFCLATRHRRRRECDPKDGEQWLTCRLWSCDESVTDLLVLCLSVSRETTPEGKRNLQTSISKKMAVEVTDSPYQVKVPLWIHIKISSRSMLIYLKSR